MNVSETVGLDPTLPDVSLILGGVERHLAFDFNAIVAAEKVTGINLLKAVVSDIDATKLRGLLWAALLKENAKLTIDEVGSWLHFKNIAVVHTAILTAWFGSVTDDTAEAATQGEETAQTTQV